MKTFYFVIFILLSMVAPPGLSNGDEQGMLEIRVKDHREAISDFSKLVVTFDAILVTPERD